MNDTDIRLAVNQHFASTGEPPSPADIAAQGTRSAFPQPCTMRRIFARIGLSDPFRDPPADSFG